MIYCSILLTPTIEFYPSQEIAQFIREISNAQDKTKDKLSLVKTYSNYITVTPNNSYLSGVLISDINQCVSGWGSPFPAADMKYSAHLRITKGCLICLELAGKCTFHSLIL